MHESYESTTFLHRQGDQNECDTHGTMHTIRALGVVFAELALGQPINVMTAYPDWAFRVLEVKEVQLGTTVISMSKLLDDTDRAGRYSSYYHHVVKWCLCSSSFPDHSSVAQELCMEKVMRRLQQHMECLNKAQDPALRSIPCQSHDV